MTNNNSTNLATGGVSPPPPGMAMLCLGLAELLGHVLFECPISALNFYLIWRTSILHPNLKYILLCQSACIFARGIVRSCHQLIAFFSSNSAKLLTTLMGIYTVPMYFRNFLPHILAMERILATIFAKRYENWRQQHFSLLWTLIVATFSVLNAIQYTTAKHPTGVTIITKVAGLLVGMLGIGAFGWMWHYNGQTYRHKQDEESRHNLSERYQLAENIRTAKQLTPTLILHLLNNFIGFVIHTLFYYDQLGTDNEYFVLVEQCQITTVTYINVLIEITILVNHPFLHRDLRRICKNWASKLFGYQPNTIGSSELHDVIGQQEGRGLAMQNMRGQALVLSQDPNQYFSQLSQYWDTKRGQKRGMMGKIN